MALAMEAREGFRSLRLPCLACNRGFGFSTLCLRVVYTSWVSKGVIVSFSSSSGSVDRADR